MRRCGCPDRWDWVFHDWCPLAPGNAYVESPREETYEEERRREVGERFASDVDLPD